MNVKLLFVDDHPMLRRGLCEAVTQFPNFTLVGETSSGVEALKLVASLAPDLIVMDIHLPDMSGIEVSRQILAAHPSIKVIIFSSDPARGLVDDALQAGVCGYVLKSGVIEELVQAIQLVMQGKLYLSPELNTGILEEYRKNLAGNPSSRKVSETKKSPATWPLASNPSKLTARA